MPKTVTMGNFCYPKGISSNNCILQQRNILKWLFLVVSLQYCGTKLKDHTYMNIYEDIQANPSPENTGSPQFHVERTNNVCMEMKHEPESFGPRAKMSLHNNCWRKLCTIHIEYGNWRKRPPRDKIVSNRYIQIYCKVHVMIYIFAMSKMNEHILKTLGPYGMLTFRILIIYIKYVTRNREYGYFVNNFVTNEVSDHTSNTMICYITDEINNLTIQVQ